LDIVTVKNRSSRPLQGTFDGVPYVLKPHEERPMLANVAEMIMRQNPVMGTEDATDNNRSTVSLVGIKEWGTDCSPIEQSKAVERFDRSTVPDAEGQKARAITLTGGKPTRVRVAEAIDNPIGIDTR
jgi:hypothetical protein